VEIFFIPCLGRLANARNKKIETKAGTAIIDDDCCFGSRKKG
jgi:hypothetical protein